MKTLKQKAIYRIVLPIILLIAVAGAVFSQPAVDVSSSKFLILIETTNDGLKLTSQEGCAWEKLTFTLETGNSQAIDQYGMTSLKRHTSSESKTLPDFLFIIKKTKEGISFEGKEGTAWGGLSMGCSENKCYGYLDQNGIIVKS